MIIKRERMQVIISFFACVMLLLAFINILFNHEQIEAQAATVGWVQESNGKWRYYHANGSYTISDWEKINEKWYHFDSQGYMQTGWIYVNSKWYYLKSSGAMKTGWLHLNNKWYYLKSSGAAAISEWEKINDEWYYFGSDRVMYVGSCNVAGVPSLFGANGNLISQNLPVTAEAQSNESSCWAACAVMVGRYRTNSTRTQSMVINRYPFAITANEVDSLNYTVKAVKYVSINTKNAFSQSPLYSYAQVQSQISANKPLILGEVVIALPGIITNKHMIVAKTYNLTNSTIGFIDPANSGSLQYFNYSDFKNGDLQIGNNKYLLQGTVSFNYEN